MWTRQVTDVRVEDVAADAHGGLVLVLSPPPPGEAWVPARVQRLDGLTGAVSWEYYSDDGSLSEAAVHPDGTVFVTDRDYEVTTSLVALEGETGATQRWPLPWQDSQARASGPIVRADGRVVVLSDPRDGSCTSLDLVELASPTAGGLTVTDVTLASPDCYFYPDEYRLLPDGADGLLIAQLRDQASVRRLGADGIVSDRTDLVPPLALLPVIEAEYVVGETVAHALVKQRTGSVTDPYVTSYVQFDPATLTVDSTTDLGADPYVRLRFLDSADAVHYSGPPGGAERPLGGAVGPHDAQVAAGLWAALGNGPALIEGPAFEENWASAFLPGGAQSDNNSGQNIYVPVPLQTNPNQEIIRGVLEKIYAALLYEETLPVHGGVATQCADWLTTSMTGSFVIGQILEGNLFGHGIISADRIHVQPKAWTNVIAAFVGRDNGDGPPRTPISTHPDFATFAITVNDNGAFFHRTNPQRPQEEFWAGPHLGGSPQAQAGILIHELAHLMQASGFRKDGGGGFARWWNDALLESKCGLRIASIP